MSHIPPSISDICILYYYQAEVFDIVSKNVVKSSDSTSITAKDVIQGWDNANYGILDIESNTDNKYRWDFQLKLSGCDVMIGIMDSKEIHPEEYCILR